MARVNQHFNAHFFFLEWLLHVFGRGHCAMPAYLCALSFTLSRLKQQVFKASWELDARQPEDRNAVVRCVCSDINLQSQLQAGCHVNLCEKSVAS